MNEPILENRDLERWLFDYSADQSFTKASAKPSGKPLDVVRTLFKCILMQAYCRGWVSLERTQRVFDRLHLTEY